MTMTMMTFWAKRTATRNDSAATHLHSYGSMILRTMSLTAYAALLFICICCCRVYSDYFIGFHGMWAGLAGRATGERGCLLGTTFAHECTSA